MKRVRICIYGGTDLQGTPTDFISALAYKILDSIPAVIISGGFRHSNKNPNAISTDVAALRGTRRYADERGVDLKDCYEAWIPEPDMDSRPDIKGAVRMSEAADGIAVRVMTGRTPLGRRLAMVAGVDVVVTISGRQHTEVGSCFMKGSRREKLRPYRRPPYLSSSASPELACRERLHILAAL